MDQHPDELADFCRGQYRPLARMLGLYTGSPETGQELAQETLARVYLKWGQVRDLDDPVAWARRVGLNLANSYFRRSAAERRAKKRLSTMPGDSVPSPDSSAGAHVRAAVARLPERQRTALILRYYIDLSVLDAAEWMGVPEGTVKSLTKRAVERLRKDAGILEAEEIWNVT